MRKATAELSIGRYLDQDIWCVQTNDKRTADKLQRQGWTTSGDGPYWIFKLPEKAVCLRSRKTVDGFKRSGGVLFTPKAGTEAQTTAAAEAQEEVN